MIEMATDSRLHKVFCENVRSRRQQLGLTQQQVAERLGITQAGYANIETGRCVPGLNLVERVAAALAIPPAVLLSAREPAEKIAHAS